ncbi:TPA: hypothetical protein ACT5CJ_002098, partial [Flavobacterium psychrophilum]
MRIVKINTHRLSFRPVCHSDVRRKHIKRITQTKNKLCDSSLRRNDKKQNAKFVIPRYFCHSD